MKKYTWKSMAFTLVELLVTLGIVALIAGVAVPTYLSSQQRAKDDNAISRAAVLDLAKTNLLQDQGEGIRTQWEQIDTDNPGDLHARNQAKYETLRSYITGSPQSFGTGVIPVGENQSKYYVPAGYEFDLGAISDVTTVKKAGGAVLAGLGSGTAAKLTVNSSNLNHGIVSGSGTYAFGQKVTISAIPRSLHSFSNWTVTAGTGTLADANSATTTFTLDSTNTTQAVQANFVTNPNAGPVLTIDANVGGSATPSGGTALGGGAWRFTQGDNTTVTATPNSGYKFTGWTGDVEGGASSNPVTLRMTTDRRIRPHFSQLTASVQVNANNPAWGTVTGSGSVIVGKTVSITATPRDSRTHRFVNWTGATVADANSPNTTLTVATTNPITVTANFAAAPTYSLTMAVESLSGGATGTTTPTVGSVTTGLYVNDIINLTALPTGTNSTFDSWSITPGDVGGWFANVLSPSTSFTMPATNVTVTARFKQSLVGGGGSSGTVDVRYFYASTGTQVTNGYGPVEPATYATPVMQRYLVGETVSFNADPTAVAPSAKYVFQGWYATNGSLVTNVQAFSANGFTNDIHYVARWLAPDPPADIPAFAHLVCHYTPQGLKDGRWDDEMGAYHLNTPIISTPSSTVIPQILDAGSNPIRGLMITGNGFRSSGAPFPLSGNTNRTIFMLARHTGGAGPAIGWGNTSGTNANRSVFSHAGESNAFFDGGPNAVHQLTGTVTALTNKYHLFVYVKDGETWKIYGNGATNPWATGTKSVLTTVGTTIAIGAPSAVISGLPTGDGVVVEAGVFKKALGADEVFDLWEYISDKYDLTSPFGGTNYPTGGLVARYEPDGLSAFNNWLDASGNLNHLNVYQSYSTPAAAVLADTNAGSLGASRVWWSGGNLGNSSTIHYGNGLRTTTTPALNPNQVTLWLLAKYWDNAGANIAVGANNTAGSAVKLNLHGHGGWAAVVTAPSTTHVRQYTNGVGNTNLWNMAALTINGVTNRLYMNGELVLTSVDLPTLNLGNGPIRIGSWNLHPFFSDIGQQNPWSWPQKGYYAEMGVYNRELSGAEIQQIWGVLKAKYPSLGNLYPTNNVSTNGLVAWYKPENLSERGWDNDSSALPGYNLRLQVGNTASMLMPNALNGYQGLHVSNNAMVADLDFSSPVSGARARSMFMLAKHLGEDGPVLGWGAGTAGTDLRASYVWLREPTKAFFHLYGGTTNTYTEGTFSAPASSARGFNFVMATAVERTHRIYVNGDTSLLSLRVESFKTNHANTLTTAEIAGALPGNWMHVTNAGLRIGHPSAFGRNGSGVVMEAGVFNRLVTQEEGTEIWHYIRKKYNLLGDSEKFKTNGLIAHYVPESIGSADVWSNSVSGNYHLTEAVGGGSRTLVDPGQNGMKGVRFNNAGLTSTNAVIQDTENRTIFLVSKLEGVGAEGSAFGVKDTSTNSQSLLTTYTNRLGLRVGGADIPTSPSHSASGSGYHVHLVQVPANGNPAFWANGVKVGTAGSAVDLPTVSGLVFFLGNDDSKGLSGESTVMEAGLYNRLLSDSEALAVSEYLMNKYNTTVVRSAEPQKGLVARYEPDGLSAFNNWLDASGNLNHLNVYQSYSTPAAAVLADTNAGSLGASRVWWSGGNLGNSSTIHYGNGLRTTTTPALNPNQVTLWLLAKYWDNAGANIAVGANNTAGSAVKLNLHGHGGWAAVVTAPSTTHVRQYTNGVGNTNLWNMAALTINGVTNRLYMNGELVLTSVDLPTLNLGNGPIRIGSWNLHPFFSDIGQQNPWSWPQKGYYAEMGVYNRELSGAEIQQIWGVLKARYPLLDRP